MPKKLPPDASFKDVVSTLPDARRYFANVYQLMLKTEKDHGSVVARIGITGTGVMPNFRIDSEDDGYKQAYDGVRFVVFDEPNTRDGNWSSSTSSLADLKALTAQQAAVQRERQR